MNYLPSAAVPEPTGELATRLDPGAELSSIFLGLSADWVAAIGQVAGALATFAAVVVALQAGRKAQKLRDADRRAQDFAQTRLISFEVAVAEDRSHALVTIINDSLEPIRDATVDEVVENGGDRVQPRYKFLPVDGTVEPRRLVRAQGKVAFKICFLDSPNGQRTTWPDETEVSIGWQDPRGKRWNLSSTGELHWMPMRGDEIPLPPPWWRQHWWDPYRDRPYASWWTRQTRKWKQRGRVVRCWFGAWYDRIRGRELRPKEW